MSKKKEPKLYSTKGTRNKKAKSLVKLLNKKYPKYKFKSFKKDVILRNPDFPLKTSTSGKSWYYFLIRKVKR